MQEINPYYHLNCDFKDHVTYRSREHYGIKDFWCKDHQVAFCKCGFEWGHHWEGYEWKKWERENLTDSKNRTKIKLEK